MVVVLGDKVQREKNAAYKEFVSGEDFGLWERRVTDHPELELGRGGATASSSTAAW